MSSEDKNDKLASKKVKSESNLGGGDQNDNHTHGSNRIEQAFASLKKVPDS